MNPLIVAALESIKDAHGNAGPSQGYYELGGYGEVGDCCGTCGSHGEYGRPWPCETWKRAETALVLLKGDLP